MVPPGYGAAYWRRGSWRHGVAGRERCRAAWCLQLEARFPGGAVSGWRGSLAARFRGLCGAGRGGMSKNSLLAWMTRAGAGVRGTGPGRTGPGERRRGAGNGAWGNGVGVRGTGYGGAASGCRIWERKAGAEAGYPSKDAGKLKRDGATRKQGMRGAGLQRGMRGKCCKKAS